MTVGTNGKTGGGRAPERRGRTGQEQTQHGQEQGGQIAGRALLGKGPRMSYSAKEKKGGLEVLAATYALQCAARAKERGGGTRVLVDAVISRHRCGLHMRSGITVFACQPVMGVSQAVKGGGQREGVCCNPQKRSESAGVLVC